jgi:hypothetical protein
MRSLAVFLTALILSANWAFAADSGFMDNFLSNVTDPGETTDPRTGTRMFSGGSAVYRFKPRSSQFPLIWDVRPPSASIGCNGFSVNGGMAMLGLDGLDTYLQEAGTSFLWGVMVGLVYSMPGLEEVFTKLREWAGTLHDILANACKTGQDVGAKLRAEFGKDKDDPSKAMVKDPKDVAEETGNRDLKKECEKKFDKLRDQSDTARKTISMNAINQYKRYFAPKGIFGALFGQGGGGGNDDAVWWLIQKAKLEGTKPPFVAQLTTKSLGVSESGYSATNADPNLQTLFTYLVVVNMLGDIGVEYESFLSLKDDEETINKMGMAVNGKIPGIDSASGDVNNTADAQKKIKDEWLRQCETGHPLGNVTPIDPIEWKSVPIVPAMNPEDAVAMLYDPPGETNKITVNDIKLYAMYVQQEGGGASGVIGNALTGNVASLRGAGLVGWENNSTRTVDWEGFYPMSRHTLHCMLAKGGNFSPTLPVDKDCNTSYSGFAIIGDDVAQKVVLASRAINSGKAESRLLALAVIDEMARLSAYNYVILFLNMAQDSGASSVENSTGAEGARAQAEQRERIKRVLDAYQDQRMERAYYLEEAVKRLEGSMGQTSATGRTKGESE